MSLKLVVTSSIYLAIFVASTALAEQCQTANGCGMERGAKACSGNGGSKVSYMATNIDTGELILMVCKDVADASPHYGTCSCERVEQIMATADPIK